MSGKKKYRPKPNIETNRRHKDEYQKCRTPECRNVIAAWAVSRSGYCMFCRSRRHR